MKNIRVLENMAQKQRWGNNGIFSIREDDIVHEGRTRTVFKYTKSCYKELSEKSILCATYGWGKM